MDVHFSVVIPFFNNVETLGRTLDSVALQECPVDVCLSDDGSAEGPQEVVERFPCLEIRVIRSDHRGVSHARNEGWKTATHTHIAFLDADDEWKAGFLQAVEDMVVRHPDAGLYSTNREHRLPDGRDAIGKRYPLRGVPDERTPWSGILPDYFDSALGRSPVACSSVVVKKSVLEEVGGFDENLHQGEDLDLWARIALRHDIAFCNRKLAVYHLSQATYRRVEANSREPAFFREAELAIGGGDLPANRALALARYANHFRLIMAHRLIVGRDWRAMKADLVKLRFVRGCRLRVLLAWARYLARR